MDIWRYFRYTWLTPYNTVPGRNINFLIRKRSEAETSGDGDCDTGKPHDESVSQRYHIADH